jgi:hypothetical protein
MWPFSTPPTVRVNTRPTLPRRGTVVGPKGQYLQSQNAQRHLINYNRPPTINIPQEQQQKKKRGWETFLFGKPNSPKNSSKVSYNYLRNGPIGSMFPVTNRFRNTRRNFRPVGPNEPLLPCRRGKNTQRNNNKPLHAPPPPLPRKINTARRNRVLQILSKSPPVSLSGSPSQSGFEYLNNNNNSPVPERPPYPINTNIDSD